MSSDESTRLHPVIHPVASELLDQVINDDKLLGHLWAAIATDKLSSLPGGKRYLVFHLLHYALTSPAQAVTSRSPTMTSSRLQTLLSDHVITALVKSVASKKDMMYSIAFKALSGACESAVKSGRQLDLVKILISSPGSILFDSITSTQTLAGLVQQLSEKDAQEYFSICLKHFYCDEAWSLSAEVRQRWAVHHLFLLACCPSLEHRPLRTSVLKLLFLHAFFLVNQEQAKIPNCDRTGVILDKSVIELVQTTFIKTVDQVTSTSHTPREEGQSSDHSSRLNFSALLELVNYAQLLLDADGISVRVGNKSSVLAAWSKLKPQIDKLQAKETKSLEDVAFLHLYLQLGHQLFSDVQATTDVLDDLIHCYTKLNTKRRKSVSKPGTEPEWVDVLTDVFVQLLSRQSHLTRRIVNVSYRLLAPHASTSSVNLILDVLKSEGGSGDDIVDFEDDSDVENGEEMDAQDEDEEESEDEEKSEDESSDEDEEEGAAVDDALVDALKAALGNAKADSDKEESESDLSDSEMFKLDEALGRAFKSHLSKRRAGHDQREQMMHFKIRVLDLVTSSVRHAHMKETLVLDIVETLVELLVRASRQKEHKPLVAKSSEALTALCKMRKFEIDHSCRDVTRITDMLTKFLNSSQKELTVSDDIKRACVFLIRLCSMDYHHASPVKTRAKRKGQETEHRTSTDLCQSVQSLLRTTLLDYFYKRSPHLDPGLYHRLFEQQTEFMVPLLPDLVQVVADGGVKIYCRTQACAMLNATLTKKLPGDKRIDWEEFGEKLNNALEKAIEAAMTGDVKTKALQVFLLALHKFDMADSAEAQKYLPRQERLLTSVRAAKHKSKDVRKAENSLHQLITRLGTAAGNAKASSPDKDNKPKSSPSRKRHSSNSDSETQMDTTSPSKARSPGKKSKTS